MFAITFGNYQKGVKFCYIHLCIASTAGFGNLSANGIKGTTTCQRTGFKLHYKGL